mmetsp:Transcript_37475/g.43751  ORF Transcript_37475/g.43751 Transcript_37475/m.43751 type:complete len:128 (+) Transcript_37475:45-428(+)
MNYGSLPDYKKDFLRTHSSQGFRHDFAKTASSGFQKSSTESKPKLGLLTKVTATNDIWDATAYSTTQWRGYLNQTFYRKDYNERPHKLSDQVNREGKKFNRTRTRVSEYSNALYNSRVFLNPRFTSC